MSTNYKNSKDIPTEVLCKRIDEIVKAITASDYGKSLLRECTMRIPAELDHDADLVLSEVARRLRKVENEPQDAPDSIKCGCYVEADQCPEYINGNCRLRCG